MTSPEIGPGARIAVLGLGYVGLPLVQAISRRYSVTGFDIDRDRVEELAAGYDRNRSLTETELREIHNVAFSTDPACLAEQDVYVITVPTPVDMRKQPDLGALCSAAATAAAHLGPGNLVIFESTVWPGATEEVCVPILEQISGLTYNRDFSVGYSPERIRSGDSAHTLDSMVKLTAGSTPETAATVEAFYAGVIGAGTCRAADIRTAEAAKLVENVQRDINIALVNELAMLFDRLDIDTGEVLRAAGSNRNFVPLHPGLVGGHCIGVDPWYLVWKARSVGFSPDLIAAGRHVNDSVSLHVASRVMRLMHSRGVQVRGSRVLILGLAFKENCPDTRNSLVFDLINALQDRQCRVDVHDPWVDRSAVPTLVDKPGPGVYDVVIVAVAHREFVALGSTGIRALCKPGGVVFDVKRLFPPAQTDGRL